MNSAAGYVRAYALLQGIPLPPSGSFKERVITETIFRERQEKYTLVSMFMRMMAVMGGVKDDFVDLLLEDYKEELFQLKYNSKYTTARDRKIMDGIKKKMTDADLLKKVAAFTAEGGRESGRSKKRKKRR